MKRKRIRKNVPWTKEQSEAYTRYIIKNPIKIKAKSGNTLKVKEI